MAQTTTKPNKSKKWLIIISSIIAAIVVAFYIGSHIRSNITDGTENYSGFKLKLAEGALAQLRLESAISPVPTHDKLRVENIRPTTQEEVQDKCPSTPGYSTDPDDPGHYTVEVSDRTLFGINMGTIKRYGCRR